MEILRDRIIFILDYIGKIEESPFIDHFKEVANKAFRDNDLKGLKMMNRDITAMYKSLKPNDISKLENLLNKKFESQRDLSKTVEEEVKLILKKRKIETEEDYRIISDYIKDVTEEDDLFDKSKEMDYLLYDYEKSLGN